MKVLITGATGFIGSHLARRAVAEGDRVIAVVRPHSDRWRIRDFEAALLVIEGDLRDFSRSAARLASDPPDVCIHLAWQGWSGSAVPIEENISSLAVSLEFIRSVAALGCRRFVGAGTCFEYDMSYPFFAEETPTRPHELYGASKRALYEVAERFAAIGKIAVAWPRIFYSYGPYEDKRRLVPSVVLALLGGEPAATTPGEQVRDYLHVGDVAAAILAVAKSSFTGPVNVASGEAVTVADIIREIGRLTGRPDLIRLGALPYREGEPARICADTSLLRKELRWSPQFDLHAGLRQTVEWWRAQAG